jgi:hypothetical protein
LQLNAIELTHHRAGHESYNTIARSRKEETYHVCHIRTEYILNRCVFTRLGLLVRSDQVEADGCVLVQRTFLKNAEDSAGDFFTATHADEHV